MSFLRCCPWKLAPPSSSPLPSLRRKLLCEAHASIRVPSTEKCSVPAESRGGLRSRRASPGYDSARPAHRAQAPGSSSADGSPAPAPRTRCTKTARPDPQMRPACQPRPIRDRKTESRYSDYGEGVFSRLLEPFLWVGLFGVFQIHGHLAIEPRQVLKRSLQLPVR